MLEHLHGRGCAAEEGSVLSEGGRGAQKTESNDCGFHKDDPVRGRLHIDMRDLVESPIGAAFESIRAIGIPNRVRWDSS